jgi:hypothetical protein
VKKFKGKIAPFQQIKPRDTPDWQEGRKKAVLALRS